MMDRPAAFMQEAGASPGSEQLPAVMDLQQEKLETAEGALVDDLLSVMMGQVRRRHGVFCGCPGGCTPPTQRVPGTSLINWPSTTFGVVDVLRKPDVCITQHGAGSHV